MQVPRVVEKREPYSYTVRMPRTVVTKVPLDPCGNPIPVAPTAAPAAVSRPTATPAPTLSAADSAPVKTYSDRPADAPRKVAEGWGASSLDHVDPAAKGSSDSSGTFRAEKPATDAAAADTLRTIEPIPTPAAKEPAAATIAPQPAPKAVPQPTTEPSPTVAPPGPAVYPPPPANDPRDVPAAETSGSSLLGRTGHTT
jgi:hypothetical protein